MRNGLIVERKEKKIKFNSKFLLKMIEKIEYNKKKGQKRIKMWNFSIE